MHDGTPGMDACSGAPEGCWLSLQPRDTVFMVAATLKPQDFRLWYVLAHHADERGIVSGPKGLGVVTGALAQGLSVSAGQLRRSIYALASVGVTRRQAAQGLVFTMTPPPSQSGGETQDRLCKTDLLRLAVARDAETDALWVRAGAQLRAGAHPAIPEVRAGAHLEAPRVRAGAQGGARGRAPSPPRVRAGAHLDAFRAPSAPSQYSESSEISSRSSNLAAAAVSLESDPNTGTDSPTVRKLLALKIDRTGPATYTVDSMLRQWGEAHIAANLAHVEKTQRPGIPVNAGRVIGACRENWAKFDPKAHEAARARAEQTKAAEAEAAKNRAREVLAQQEAEQEQRHAVTRALSEVPDLAVFMAEAVRCLTIGRRTAADHLARLNGHLTPAAIVRHRTLFAAASDHILRRASGHWIDPEHAHAPHSDDTHEAP